ncbi:MAG: D-inositol-3-phosphate glycosyltransferase [Syntrophorhabdus sp. PtaU1.Bin153]|nr:MAG: D-inositol-3-phosphate glycosyltransferase [Syntrophorhabdus sp. PtaU1.Bin153]
MRILLLNRHTVLGASSRLRVLQYLPYLRAQGFDITVAPLFGDAYLRKLYDGHGRPTYVVMSAFLHRIYCLLSSKRYDLVWMEKELFPWLPSWAEQFLFRTKTPLVVDYDDAIFHKYDLHPNRFVRRCLGKKISTIMRCSAMVIAGNEYLASYARGVGARRVAILPTAVDLDKYAPDSRSTHQDFTIGWIGTPVTAKYLRHIQSTLVRICAELPVRLILVGSGPFNVDQVPIEVRSWSERTEVADIQTFDIGIMPLPDGPWERGKCGYKLIQYMACGKPVVASPVGVNCRIVQNGINGFLAESPEDWMISLRTLLNSSNLRTSFGAMGRKMVEMQYCTRITSVQLADLLKTAAEGKN